MLWYLIQSATMAAVLGAAVYYEWPGSGLSHSIVALIAALAVTIIPYDLWQFAKRLLARRHRDPKATVLGWMGDQRGHDRIDRPVSQRRRLRR
jgi:hypothetical protein